MYIEQLESRSLFDASIEVLPPPQPTRPIGEWISNWLQGMGFGDFPNPKNHNPLWEGEREPTTKPAPTTQPTPMPTKT